MTCSGARYSSTKRIISPHQTAARQHPARHRTYFVVPPVSRGPRLRLSRSWRSPHAPAPTAQGENAPLRPCCPPALSRRRAEYRRHRLSLVAINGANLSRNAYAHRWVSSQSSQRSIPSPLVAETRKISIEGFTSRAQARHFSTSNLR